MKFIKLRITVFFICILCSLTCKTQVSYKGFLKDARDAMKKAASFYYEKISTHGGYVYYYSLDLQQRWGEGRATPDMIFVQPPGTPRVGMSYLQAYLATDDTFYLKAARDAAMSLVNGQLESGGWTQVIHFVRPEKERMGRYRKMQGGEWNYSSLDDGQTPAALKMLMLTDQVLEFRDSMIHEAVIFGLNALLNAQFPNGAFPQVWQGSVKQIPVVSAKFPHYNWKTEGILKDYWNYYNLNDNIAGHVADVLITAHSIYHENKYLESLKRLGGFLILAQMPEPQPGWCQQYNYEMIPIWARKFEPPAISAWEAQDVMETLIEIAQYTGDKKYLAPVPRALEYYRKCLLPDGRVARYYEFETNRPLYMNEKYELSYDDRNAPAHYGWKQNARFSEIEKKYDSALKGNLNSQTVTVKDLEINAHQVIKDLDHEGRWISEYAGERLVGQPKFLPGFRYISSEVFCKNLDLLSEYIISTKNKKE